MKQTYRVVLRALILCTAAIALVSLIRFPLTEGRAADLDMIHIYSDPLIIYGYIASIPFFVMLFQAFKLLGKTNKKKALTTIQYSANAFILFILGGITYIHTIIKGDDTAGPTMLGFIGILISGATAISAYFIRKRLQQH